VHGTPAQSARRVGTARPDGGGVIGSAASAGAAPVDDGIVAEEEPRAPRITRPPMQHRSMRPAPTARPTPQPVHLGPQAHGAGFAGTAPHSPNAALLIDFDNVTLGIQKDLGKELRNLLSSDIIKGKVSVQRAYADWRRYPQYIVPLSESSIDLIFAPAYGSAKKNATDIRLAIDAIELVFTRPEIGTFILLSGDSDFSSLVLKLKEYGKYVIGVGIRESASDLLVQNCDEYYSYNALAGLTKTTDEIPTRKDPWELVKEAIARMQQHGDVMRSDRLKQVMQDLDPSFDEKDLGYSKFSKFVSEAASKGLVTLTKLENGQLEVGVAGGATVEAPAKAAPSRAEGEEREEQGEREERGGRGRRGRRGRGRDRDRERDRGEAAGEPVAAPEAAASAAPAPAAGDGIGVTGERLTRDEAFSLVRRAVESLVTGDDAVPSEAVRTRAFELLGRDSESLAMRFFDRILKDAHQADVIDLRRRGDTFEVARIEGVPTVADQLSVAAAAHAPVPVIAPAAGRGLGPRGIPAKTGKRGAPPPDLLLVGVVEDVPAIAPAAAPVVAAAAAEGSEPSKGGRGKAKGAKAEVKAKPARAAKAAKPDKGTDAGAARKAAKKPARKAAKKAAKPVKAEA
jgi:uncharacterized protein (TIGR00288 family)